MATEREETGREETPREERSHFLQLLVIGLIASVIGIALGLLIDWWPAQGSAEASQVDTLYDVLIICSVPMFVLFVTVVLYCAWRYRMKPGEEEYSITGIEAGEAKEVDLFQANGGSMVMRFWPCRSATTRRARQTRTGSDFPFNVISPAGSNATATDAAR